MSPGTVRSAHLDARCWLHHDADMRTTVTLEPDVARLLEEAMHRERRTMKQVINRALRDALAGPRSEVVPHVVVPHEARVLPGLDPAGFNRLAAELEDTEILSGLGRSES